MIFVKPALASCPVCIVTVGGGLFLAKKLGIDDLLVSIWISGLNCALAFYLAGKFKNRILRNPVIMSLVFYGFTLFYLQFTNQLGRKVTIGLTLGLAAFILAAFTDRTIRKKNNGKVLFYYQKVIIPFIYLFITTVIFKVINL